MRFTVTGEWDHNRLLQVVVVLYCFFVILLWVTNCLLYFDAMDLTTASVVDHYLGDEAEFRAPKTWRGMVELAHFHLFAMGMLMMVLTHLALFVPLPARWKAGLIVIPFFSALASEGGGWLVRYGGAGFAWTKIAGFLLLQTSLAALVAIALWSVFAGRQAENYVGEDGGDAFDDEDWA
ncbi:MAG: hypothetical protein H6748_12915 [Spirochaetaceae bacterium]|nr:hypothetical protein [Myxococcales bacterium]MCB9724944.1 hypothetical protein [Spirochaetaceae bacterium]HPG27667.1 hypothetical protein [Myxococcota bacterium]